MALLVIDGFEQYDVDTDLTRGGWSSISIAAWDPVAGRHGSDQCIQCLSSGLPIVKAFPATDVVTVGFAVQFTSGLINTRFFNIRNDATDHIGLDLTAAGELEINRGTTALEITSGLGLNSGQWYYIEVDVTIHDSTGTYDVFVDGSSIMSDTGVDTKNGTTTDVNNIEFVSTTTTDMKIDDLYILDDAGTDNTGPLGDCRVETVFPDADGNENDFTRVGGGTNNYEAVDDGLTPDDDTTYNWSATATDRELYNFAALAGSVGTVFGVDAKMLVRKEDAGVREVRTIARNGTTEVESGNLTLGVDWQFVNNIYENNPNGGSDWIESTVNTAQFGLDLQT